MLVLVLGHGELCAEDWVHLFNQKNLQGWESVGDGLWSVTPEGYLLGQRDPRKPAFEAPWLNRLKGKLNRSWLQTNFRVVMSQAWLYTGREFYEYDLHLEWWLPPRGNSGISIHDPTRGRYTFGDQSDLRKTPSQVGYEIQINNQYPDSFASGSIYMIQKAESGFQKENDWNAFDIEVRENLIRVKLNGQLVAQHPTLPDRPKTGPIGLQLHDAKSLVMFRNIRIREVSPVDRGPNQGKSPGLKRFGANRE